MGVSFLTIDSTLNGDWTIDPSHSRFGFSTRHAMVTRVRGAFNDVEGRVHLDTQDWDNSVVEITVQVGSVDTRNAQRDEHLRSSDFFDAENFPVISFTSTGMDEVDESRFIVSGDLTIRGISRPITIPLELTGIDTDADGSLRAGLEGGRRIDRKDWGVTWNTPLDSGGVLVSDKISLEFELSLIKN